MATAAAAMAAKARREVKDLFFDKDAFSPERAVEFDPRLPIQRRFLEQLIAEGVIHELSPGRYWFDLEVYQEQRHKQFVWSVRILLLGAVVFLLVFAIRHLR